MESQVNKVKRVASICLSIVVLACTVVLLNADSQGWYNITSTSGSVPLESDIVQSSGEVPNRGSTTQSSTELSTLPPTSPPTEPPTSPPTEPPTSPPTEPPTSPPTEPPTSPPTEPPTSPPTEPPTSPPTEPPTSPPTEPPTSPPTEPPTSPPTEPPTSPPTEPPTSPPTEPPTIPPVSETGVATSQDIQLSSNPKYNIHEVPVYPERISDYWNVVTQDCHPYFQFPNVVNKTTFRCDRTKFQIADNVTIVTSEKPFVCGGINVYSGGCFVSAESKYEYKTKSPKLEVITSHPYPAIPLCATSRDYFETQTKENKTRTPACQLLQAFSPRDLVSFTRTGISIVFVGQSHTRNIFDALVAVLRNQETLVMRHGDAGVKNRGEARQYRYNPRTRTDSYKVYIGKREHETMLDSHCEECVTITYYFSPSISNQAKVLSNEVARHTHDVLILGYARGYRFSAHSPEWKQAVYDILKRNPKKMVLGHIWWAKGGGKQLSDGYESWMNEVNSKLESGEVSTNVLVWGYRWGMMPKYHREFRHALLDNIWHNVCTSSPSFTAQVANTPPLHQFLGGLEKCDYLFSRLAARIVVTTTIQYFLQDTLL